MKTDLNKRIVLLDVVKVIASIMVVCLHSYSGGAKLDLVLRCFTSIAVPMFMSVSGYLLFFSVHNDQLFWLKMLKKYSVTLFFWLLLYMIFLYFILLIAPDISFVHFAITNSDGWAYWYLEVLLEILLIYPIISKIVLYEDALKLYIIFWTCFVSIRQSLMIYAIPRELFNLIQIPLFQNSFYIGGTHLAHYPTECLGVFIALGFFIKLLLDKKIKKRKTYISLLSGFCFLYVILMAGKLLREDRPIDMVLQPISLPVLILSMGALQLIVPLCERLPEQTQTKIVWLSEKSLGIYLTHPFTIVLASKLTKNLALPSVFITGIRTVFTVSLSLVVVIILQCTLPKKLRYYLI